MADRVRVEIRVTEAEKAVIERHAAIAGLTVSAYARQRLLHPERIGLLTVDDFEVLVDVSAQLHGACNNLNQFMLSVHRHASRLPDVESLDEAQALITNINGLVTEIRDLIRG